MFLPNDEYVISKVIELSSIFSFINDRLLVQVALSGKIMNLLNPTWIRPATLKITRQSQLKILLCDLGVPSSTNGSDVVSSIFKASV